MPRLRSRSGTTLIELIVVLAIIGITLGVSSVAIGALADRLAEADQEVERLLTRARGLSAQRAEPVRIRFVAGARYELLALDSLQVLEQGSLVGTEVAPVPAAITFFPIGTASGGPFCARVDSRWDHVRIDPITGTAARESCPHCCPSR